MRGEVYEDEVIQSGVPEQSPDAWQARLRSDLVDFVAESGFGWGQDRS